LGTSAHPETHQHKTESLLSVGTGLRLGVGNYFSASVDYGFPLMQLANAYSYGRFHVRISLAY
jgi:hemolysin activation/secretion protein